MSCPARTISRRSRRSRLSIAARMVVRVEVGCRACLRGHGGSVHRDPAARAITSGRVFPRGANAWLAADSSPLDCGRCDAPPVSGWSHTYMGQLALIISMCRLAHAGCGESAIRVLLSVSVCPSRSCPKLAFFRGTPRSGAADAKCGPRVYRRLWRWNDGGDDRVRGRHRLSRNWCAPRRAGPPRDDADRRSVGYQCRGWWLVVGA